jgi:RNA polymerase sigma-70 factor (ECF subfamily)
VYLQIAVGLHMADSKEISLNEFELVEGLRQHKTEVIAQIYNAYADRIYSIVFNQVDKNHEIAQEIVQDTFLAAIKSAKCFKGKSQIFTWLCSIANNKVADYYRSKKQEINKIRNYTSELSLYTDNDQGVSIFAESEENDEIIRKALSELPIHYRQVLILKYVEGFSVNDISIITSRSKKSVEGLITRARREFHKKLKSINEG